MHAHAHGSWGEFMFVHTAGLDAAWTFVCHHDPSHYSMCPAIYTPDSKGSHAAAVIVSGMRMVWCWWHALALPVTFLRVRFPIL